MENGIKIQAITKHFGTKTALDNVSCIIPKGKIVGLLGPNGAGKSTFIRCLLGIATPDTGSIWYDGMPYSKAIQKRMGYLPEERGLYRKMKVLEQLQFFGTIKGLSPTQAKRQSMEWLERFNYQALADQWLERLSKGQQQVVQFIASVVHHPEWLVLDEPFSGFDPANADIVSKEIIRLHKEQGTTILYSTHRMETVEGLCEELIFIHQSKLVYQGLPQDIRQTYAKGYVYLKMESALPPTLQAHVSMTLGAGAYQLSGVRVADVIGHLPKESKVTEIKEMIPSMQEVFLTIVGAA
ncbi:MAG: ATP-binding cassette domain-containing protein [Cytophagaceae bacterium]|jgi:ABC-2 type transport system ATP-binding protein|nr:ATP-binding cassette domain-containing protein [Cytophagaceae bacterium]